jgi:hypothetical protein
MALIALMICGKSMIAAENTVPTMSTLDAMQHKCKHQYTKIEHIHNIKQDVIKLDGFIDATRRLLSHAETVRMNELNQLKSLREAEIAQTEEKLKGMRDQVRRDLDEVMNEEADLGDQR